jgi:uncharacterized repeat protein (TIGR04138 family)
MNTESVPDRIRTEILGKKQDARYRLAAYLFTLSGLEFFFLRIGERRHVKGQDLSLALLGFAQKQFGPLAREVLRYWGINATGDFGQIVFNLISIDLLGKQEDDRIEDFDDVVDLDEFFSDADPFEIDREFIRKS